MIKYAVKTTLSAKHAGSHVLLDYIIEIISLEFNFQFRGVWYG